MTGSPTRSPNRSTNFGMYAVAAAIVVGGALWVGIPVGTLAVVGLVLVCPLMMLLMMGGLMSGMHGPGRGEQDRHDRTGDRADDREDRDASNRS